MLVLHCGWPGTGTSGLQAAFFERRAELAAAGVLYPDRWRVGAIPAHYGLEKLLGPSLEAERGRQGFKRLLSVSSGRDVVLSDEGITAWLPSADGRRAALLDFLAAVREETPTRCVWTLRRFDEVVRSGYLLMLSFGFDLPFPDEYLEGNNHWHGIREPDPLFGGMKEVEQAADDVVHVKYDVSGAHNGALMEAFCVPAACAEEVGAAIEGSRRINARLEHKQVVTLLNLKEVSALIGEQLDRGDLRRAFRRGAIRFADDGPCELFDRATKRALDDLAVASARRHGYRAYLDCFGAEEIEGPPSVSLGAEALDDDDLERLLAFQRGGGAAAVSRAVPAQAPRRARGQA